MFVGFLSLVSPILGCSLYVVVMDVGEMDRIFLFNGKK